MNFHLKESPVKLNIPKQDASGYAILCLHGRNQTPAFMQDILKKMGWENIPVILPTASEKAWYPKGFMADLNENLPDLDYSLETVEHYHKELNDLGYSDENIILMGFSQGACLMAQYALLHPNRYKSIIIFTGGYIGEDEIDWKFKGDFEKTPVYITTSEIDEWVPVSRTKETANEFNRLNAKVELKIFENRPHEVSEEEIKATAKYL